MSLRRVIGAVNNNSNRRMVDSAIKARNQGNAVTKPGLQVANCDQM